MLLIQCKSCKEEICAEECKFHKEKKALETLILKDLVLKLPTEEEKTAFISDILRSEGLDPIPLLILHKI